MNPSRTLARTTMRTKHEVDPLLNRENLQPRVTNSTAGQDAASGLISPVFADLSGLPPLIIQAGTHEVLLDDAVRLAGQPATADVERTLDITPACHTFSRRWVGGRNRMANRRSEWGMSPQSVQVPVCEVSELP